MNQPNYPITPLKPDQAIYRRHGELVIRITTDGVAIRGRGRHGFHQVAWEQVAAMVADEKNDTLVAFDKQVGRQVLAELGAVRDC